MKAAPKSPKTAALRYAYERFVGDSPERIKSIDRERLNLEIGCRIYDLRTAAGLSQRELAKRVGTSASNICRLEDADYRGNSLAMLRRIAHALDAQLEVRFVPLKRPLAAPRKSRK